MDGRSHRHMAHTKMRMNLACKLTFALEHVAHLEDLIEGNEYEQYLAQNLSTMKYELERQLHNLPEKMKEQWDVS